jgi:hypothetical protein
LKTVDKNMIENTEFSSSNRNYMCPSPEHSIIAEKDIGKEFITSFQLGSREERASLLKNGINGKDIESEYLKRNGIVVVGINWQDLKSE